MLGHVVARVEGELLQVHERDAQRHRGLEPPFGPQVHRRVQRHHRRRRLRAGARVRRDRPRRRPLVRGEPARGAAARRAARHRRADAPHRQAPACGAISRTSSARWPKACARSARRNGGWSTPCEAAAVRADGEASVRVALAATERPAGGRDGRRAHAARRARSTTAATTTSTSTSRSTGARGAPPSRCRRRSRCRPKASIRSSPRARRGGRSRWRASSTTRSCCLRTNELDIGTWILKTRGDAAHVLAADATLAAPPGALVRARDDRHAAAHARAARRLVAHALRADRAGLVLRRHAVRARARRRSQLHARAADDEARGADDRAVRDELRRVSDGQRPVAPRGALLRRDASRWRARSRRSAGR